MDVPAVYGAGAALKLGELALVTADARYITYSSTDGFADSGFNPDFSVAGFGWDDIWVGAFGVEVRPASDWAIRGGYNYSQNPIPSAWAAINLPAPAIVQHHLTGGLGFRSDGGLGVDLAVYHAFENQCAGPFQTAFGTMDVTNRCQRLRCSCNSALHIPTDRSEANQALPNRCLAIRGVAVLGCLPLPFADRDVDPRHRFAEVRC